MKITQEYFDQAAEILDEQKKWLLNEQMKIVKSGNLKKLNEIQGRINHYVREVDSFVIRKQKFDEKGE